MPLVVDHDARRRQVAEVTAQLIAKAGIEAVTVREVAQAAGYSTAVVSHYFENKNHLMLHTYRATVLRAHRRMEAALEAGGGDLLDYLAALLPADADRRRDWLVWFAFWTVAVADPVFSTEQRTRARQAVVRLADLLRRRGVGKEAARAGARHLLTLIYGIAVQAAFDPEEWPPHAQIDPIRAELRRVLEESGL